MASGKILEQTAAELRTKHCLENNISFQKKLRCGEIYFVAPENVRVARLVPSWGIDDPMFGNSAAEEALTTSSATYNCVLHVLHTEVTYFRSHKNMNMLFNNKAKHTCRMWHLGLNWNFFKKIEMRTYFSQSHQELETTIITVIPKTLIRLIGWILMCNNYKFDFRTYDKNLTDHIIQFGNTYVTQDCTLCLCSTLTFPETFRTLSKISASPLLQRNTSQRT